MKTKTIFKALALAMLMPAMMLTTACSSDDDSIINNENINKQNTAKKGYALPVTVNVTRQGDAATRASFDGSKLNFSEGDKLFVNGRDNDGAGKFAGELTWQSGGTFSGTIYTENPYSGTADKLFSDAPSIYATLLPNGYESTGFLYVVNNNTTEIYDDVPNVHETFAFVASETAKATGVEQLSWEWADAYNSGFALTPLCAVLNFTISGLAAGTQNVTLKMNKDKDYLVTGSVTPNASGVATFAVGVKGGSTIRNMENNLTVGSSNFTLPSSTTFAAGKIYNITRSATPAGPTYPVALSAVTTDYLGSVVTTDGNVYATVDDATTAGETAVAMIAYVGSSTDHATHTHGLAIALADESNSDWSTAKSTCEGKSAVTNAAWLLPSESQWNAMFKAFGGNEEQSTGLNTAITTAGGTALQEDEDVPYWSSSEYDDDNALSVHLNDGGAVWWYSEYKDESGFRVRACLAF